MTRDEQFQKRKEQLLLIALDEFIEKGYYGTSTREIAKLAGISSGLMFHYFESKLALYEALIEIGCSKMELAYTEEDSPFQILETMVRELFSLISEKSVAAKIFLFMGAASYNASRISDRAGELFLNNDIIRKCVPLIERGQKLSEIRDGDPLVLSITFWSSIQGIAEAVAKYDAKLPEVGWVMDLIHKMS